MTKTLTDINTTRCIMTGKNPLGNGKEPQSYEGINIIVPLGGWRLVKSTRAPTSNDIKYPIGTVWVNTSTNAAYILTSAPGNWQDFTGGSGSFTNITATGSITAGTTLTSGTGITATTGNITATNGNLVMGTAGNKIIVPTGSNASAGTSAAMSGTPGAVTVATTASSATCLIFYSRNVTGGTPGQVSITAQSGTGFTLTSTGNETSTFNWWIINA